MGRREMRDVCVSWEKQGSSLFGNNSLYGDLKAYAKYSISIQSSRGSKYCTGNLPPEWPQDTRIMLAEGSSERVGSSAAHTSRKAKKFPMPLLPQRKLSQAGSSLGAQANCEQRLKKKTQPGLAGKDQMLALNNCHVEMSHLKDRGGSR